MNRSTVLPCYRTDHQKFTTYRGDSTGRDTYVIMSDGGLQPEPFRKGIRGRDPFHNYIQRVKYQSPVHTKLLKPFENVYYPPDGTGRDTYIIKNNGGYCNEQFSTAGINFAQNTYLRDQKTYAFTTPKKDKLFQDLVPQMRTFNNWPSREAVLVNQENYRKQVEQSNRLSPSSIMYQAESRFQSPRRSSYYKDKDITELVQDPIAMAVEINREKQRTLSTLKATQSQSKRLLESLKSPLARVNGPHITLAHKFYSGTDARTTTPNVSRSQRRHNSILFRNINMTQPKKRRDIQEKIQALQSSRHIFDRAKHSSTDIINKNSVINRGAVTKASFPSFVGMTPDFEQITMKSTKPSLTDKNKQANEKAKLSLTTGNFRFEMPRQPWTTKNGDKSFMNATS